jgi:Ca2+-binding EF-hand superfamily protein
MALDADHDGVISAEEIRNAPVALRTLDKNGDGQLTQDELRPAFPEGRGGERREEGSRASDSDDMVQTLMAFDKNKDGKISKDELPERMQGLFDRADANHDGFLTPDEIRKLAAQTASSDEGERRDFGRGEGREEGRGGPPRQDPLMAALDANHDGVISADELAHASEALKTLDKNSDGQLTPDEYRPNFGRGPRRQ